MSPKLALASLLSHLQPSSQAVRPALPSVPPKSYFLPTSPVGRGRTLLPEYTPRAHGLWWQVLGIAGGQRRS